MIKVNNGYVDARELHSLLDSKKAFSTWIKKKIKSAYLEINKDFIPKWEESSGGRRSTNYLLTVDAAKHIAVIQQTKEGKELRDYLLSLDKKVQNSELHTDDQIIKMIQLKEVFKYVCYQDDVERLHQAKFVSENYNKKNPYSEFHIWRNKMLELEPKVVEERIKQYCAEHIKSIKVKSKKEKLIIIDKYETIRNAVWDFLELKGELNALKVANLVKRMAETEGTILFRNNESDLFRQKEELPLLSNIKKLK